MTGILFGVLISYWAAELPFLADLTGQSAFRALVNLGMFFVMLYAGLQSEPRELLRTSGSAVLVATGGFFLPMALGVALAWWWLPESNLRLAQSLFVGTALAITALPISVKVLMDLGRLHTPIGQLIVSAALIDDVLSLLALAVVMAVIETGAAPGLDELAALLGKVVIFFGIAIVLGWFVFPRIGRYIERARVAEFEFSMLLVSGLTYALLAELLGLHFIIGAFLAGLFIGPRTTSDSDLKAIDDKVSAVTKGFFGPLFFASIGLHVSFSAVTEVPVFLLALLLIAVLGKLVGAGIPAYWCGFRNSEPVAIGLAMSGRGAVELIIANIALEAGLFVSVGPPSQVVTHLFSSIVLVAIVTTLAMPISLRHALIGASP